MRDVLTCPYCGKTQTTHEADTISESYITAKCEWCHRKFLYSVEISREYESYEDELLRPDPLHRGKRMDNGEWVEGYVVIYPSGKTEIHKKCNELTDILAIYQIIPETLSQYTGMEDLEEKKIFHGDILKRDSGMIAYVTWSESGWCIRNKGELSDRIFLKRDADLWKIIGNIFDDFHLLNIH